MPTKTNIYNISSFNYQKMDDLTKLSSGIWEFPKLSFKNEDILNVYISVLHAEFVNSTYIINQNNNVLLIDDSVNGLQTINLTIGNYNINSFISMFATVAPTGYTINYSSITNKLTVYGPRAFTVLASSSSNGILGIGASDISSSLNAATFGYCVNLLPVARFNLRSTIFNIGNFASDNSTDVLLSIQNNGSIGSRLLYSNFGALRFQLNIDNLTAFDFRITDDNNNLLDFNGSPWYVTFQIDVEYLEKQKPPSFQEIINDIGGRKIIF